MRSANVELSSGAIGSRIKILEQYSQQQRTFDKNLRLKIENSRSQTIVIAQ